MILQLMIKQSKGINDNSIDSNSTNKIDNKQQHINHLTITLYGNPYGIETRMDNRGQLFYLFVM